MKTTLAGFIVLVITSSATRAGQPLAVEAVREAAKQGLALVQQAAKRYPENRKCFSCHHQTLPLLAMVAAKEKALAIDEEIFQQQAEFTHKAFTDRIDSLREGEGIGGRAATVAYGLWSLDLAGRSHDETSAAMVGFLIKTQKPEGKWAPQSHRPPLEESHQMNTVLAGYYMQKFQTEEQQDQVAAALERAKVWLAKEPAKVQEDRVARLWGLALLGGAAEEIAAARAAVLKEQRDDGGWAQRESMASDAYATGQTVYVLLSTGLPAGDARCRRGLRWLLEAQREDGSWFVQTHSKPVQVYFDNGDPHGKNQFISTPASAWAVAALLASQPGSR